MQPGVRPPQLLLVVAVALVGGLSACPTVVEPLPPDTKPQVTISMPVVDVVGENLVFTVHTSGCESVRTLEIYDGAQFIKPVTPTPPETLVTVQANELDYSRGFALSIAFRARVVCADGRENLSRAQAATYLPVESVVTPPPGDQVVPDLFTAEGSGEDTTFVGCTWNSTYSQTTFVRVDVKGAVVDESLPMPFACTHSTVVTPRHAGSGKRWLWDPVGGAVAVDDGLLFSGQSLGALQGFVVDPLSGDAILSPRRGGTELERVRHNAPDSPRVWDPPLFINGILFGRLVATATETLLPLESSDRVEPQVETLSVSRVDTATGEVVDSVMVLAAASDATPYPQHEAFPVTVSGDGTRVYIPRLGSDGRAAIRACSTEVRDCSRAPGLIWESTPHEEWPTFIAPYANGSRILVASGLAAMVLDASDGKRIGNPVFPTGAQAFFDVAFGEGEALFLLTAPRAEVLMPTGVVAIDDPALGEVFRYSVRSGSFAMSVDEEGIVWMRLGARLAKALPLSDYRRALSTGTPP